MRRIIGAVAISGVVIVSASACQSNQHGDLLIPLSHPAATSVPTGSVSTTTPAGAAGISTSAPPAEMAVANAAFALHRDDMLLIKQTTFHDPLTALAAALKQTRTALYTEQSAALANYPNCPAILQNHAQVISAAANVTSADQAFKARVNQIQALIAALSGDSAALTSALSQAATPDTSDVHTALATATQEQTTAQAAITAATSTDTRVVTLSTQITTQAAQIASKACP